jgi:hypothetical protein
MRWAEKEVTGSNGVAKLNELWDGLSQWKVRTDMKLLFCSSVCGALLHCFVAASQTNCGADLNSLFSFHNVQLRSLTSGTEQASNSLSGLTLLQSKPWETSQTSFRSNKLSLESDEFAAQITSDGFKTDSERRMYRELDEQGYLTRQLSDPERNFDYYFGQVFYPEEFRFGKTTVSCSLVTAIKRRNPLCLINPLFFQMTW